MTDHAHERTTAELVASLRQLAELIEFAGYSICPHHDDDGGWSLIDVEREETICWGPTLAAAIDHARGQIAREKAADEVAS